MPDTFLNQLVNNKYQMSLYLNDWNTGVHHKHRVFEFKTLIVYLLTKIIVLIVEFGRLQEKNREHLLKTNNYFHIIH